MDDATKEWLQQQFDALHQRLDRVEAIVACLHRDAIAEVDKLMPPAEAIAEIQK